MAMEILAIFAIAAGWWLSTYPLCGYWLLDFLLGAFLGYVIAEFGLRWRAPQNGAESTKLDFVSLRAMSILMGVFGAMLLYPVWLILRDAALRSAHPALISQSLCLLGMGFALLVRIALSYHAQAKV